MPQPRPYLPPDIVRLIDGPLRAAERAEILRAMNGRDINRTLCDAALAGGMLDVRFLLAAGADAGAGYGNALFLACFGGHLLVAEALLDASGTLPPGDRNVALLNAAHGGSTACCELMLDRGADVHFRLYGIDALSEAAYNGHLDTVAFLLDHGADARSAQSMQAATDRGHAAVVALLLARRGGAAQ